MPSKRCPDGNVGHLLPTYLVVVEEVPFDLLHVLGKPAKATSAALHV